jgi:Ca2+-binding RTX toxin-like protein
LNGDTITGLSDGDVIEVTGDTNFATSLHGDTVGGSLTIGGSTISLTSAGAGLFIKGTVLNGNSVLTLTTTDPNASVPSSGGSDAGSTVLSVSARSARDLAGSEISRTLTNSTGGTATGTLLQNTGSGNVITATLPNGMSIQMSGSASAQSGAGAGSSLSALIQDKAPDAGSQSFLTGHGNTFLGSYAGSSVDIQSFGFLNADGGSVRISGEYVGGGEAFVFDASGLPSGTTLKLNYIDFAAIVGTATVHSLSGHTYLAGDTGAQSLTLAGGNNTAAGGGGDDSVWSSDGDDVVYGNQGSDHLYGDDGLDTLFGGQGNDSLQGQSGDDSLAGNLGDDVLSGGDGADVFIFEVNGGNDTVADFQAGVDSLQVAGGLSYAAVQIGSDTVLTLSDGGTVTLIGVSVSNLAFSLSWDYG